MDFPRTSALHTDMYQITMMYAHWKNGTHQKKRAFDLYFRRLPFGNGYAVFAGLERAIQYLQGLKFTEEEIEYIQSLDSRFEPEFLELLRNLRFTGDVYAIQEGSIVFPSIPLLHIQGSVIELQLIETALLNFIGYQTLVATKAARIKEIASQDILLEFGSRRAQEQNAAIWGARAAYISGFHATSNLLAGKLFGIPTSGTHAHAWVQDFPEEIDAFRAYANAFPDKTILLVDTYDTLQSGVPNAIKVGLEMKARGEKLYGIRLDSGDLAYLSKCARQMLDEAGLTDTIIVASSDLDENTLLNLKAQGAKIDAWGIGTKLITAYDQPALGAVYKLVARYENEKWEPTIKISSNPEKITTPGIKEVYRVIDQKTGKATADLLTLQGEKLDLSKPLHLFHPTITYKQKTVVDFDLISLLKPILRNGKLVTSLPSLQAIRKHHQEELELFWEEYRRTLHPEEYPVDLSDNLWTMKQKLLQKIYRKNKKK